MECRLIENHRRFGEVIKGENDCANKQNKHLQWYLGRSVEEQAQTAILE
jgi:hypothetical protein